MDHATWMADHASVLGNQPFNQIVLPGTHDSGTYALSPLSPIAMDADAAEIVRILKTVVNTALLLLPQGQFFFDAIVAGWAKAQFQSILGQLLSGIRYLDLRIYSHDRTLYLVHSMYQTPVSDAIHDLAQFIKQSPREIVVVNLQHFYAMSDEDHRSFIAFLETALGDALIPNSTPLTTSLNDLWRAKHTVMVVYGDDYIARHPHPRLWSAGALRIPWPELEKTPTDVLSFLQRELPHSFSPTQLFGVLGTITPDGGIIAAGLIGPPNNLFDLAVMVNAPVLQWVKSLPANAPINFVIFDWYEQVPLVDTVIQMNLRRVTVSSSTWIANREWTGAYGPPGGSVGQMKTYADANAVNVPAGSAATGFQFYFTGNRLVPNLEAGPLGEKGTWLPRVPFDPRNPNFIPHNDCSGIGDTGRCTLYIDTTPLLAPRGKVVVGIQLRLKINNRIAPLIVCATPALNYSDPQVVLNDENNFLYFAGGSNLHDFFVDAEPLSCPAGSVIIGFSLRRWDNRISFELLTIPATELPHR